MQYGDWELRDNSAYYPAQNIILYPSSNSSDSGSLHIESNVRAIARRITSKSYKLHDSDFNVTITEKNGKHAVDVSAGEANIQGYHLIVNSSISLELPTSTIITPWTLGISLSYDAANNVTGDVVIYDKPLGENEYFSGAYLFFFDPCQLRQNYDNILVLGRVWELEGKVVGNTSITDASSPYYGYHINNGFEPDPNNDHAFKGKSVEIQVEGASLSQYDAVQNKDIPNITDMSKYDTMMYEAEQNPSKYTKPPTITTDLQDYLNYVIDWYPSKFGDYMTGALRFDQLSLDAKRVMDSEYAHEYVKDASNAGTSGRYHDTAGVFISPRPLGKLSDRSALDLTSGGTIMSIVPYSYKAGIDYDYDTATYSALISSKSGDTGMRIRSVDGRRSRISHADGGHTLLIENSYVSASGESNKSSIHFVDGEIFVDSHNAKGIQLHSASSSTKNNNVAFRFDAYTAAVDSHSYSNHGISTNSKMAGLTNDTRHIEYGLGCSYDGVKGNYKYPYLQIGNLMLRSNKTGSDDWNAGTKQVMIPTIQSYNSNTTVTKNYEKFPTTYNKSNSSVDAAYVRVLPGLYTPDALVPNFIQVGATKEDDILNNNAILNTCNRILMYKHSSNDTNQNDGYTAFEQHFGANSEEGNSSNIFNKFTPFTAEPTAANHANTYREIGGIYSYGNIGASSARLKPYTGRDHETGPYHNDAEWVRFTRYRYDKDQDEAHGGDNNAVTNGHARDYGTTYNIEFNTNVANKRANQIIWNYNGSASANNQPLTLSYIHDEYEERDSGTNYPNSSYYDHNMYLHQNPTYGVRDFLRIDGGGLSIHGDVNNPTLSGDENNSQNRFGMTLIQGRIYASVYNDYAETYHKAHPEEQAVEGMVVMLDTESGNYKICNEEESTLVVGVISDNYGMLIGGKSIDSARDHVESVEQLDNFAVGVSGKLVVNLIDNDVAPGDLLVSASKHGLAKAIKDRSKIIPGTVIGKALSKSVPVEGKDYYQCLMQIMLS